MSLVYNDADVKDVLYGSNVVNSIYYGDVNIYKRMKSPIIAAYYGRYSNYFKDLYNAFYLDTDLNIIRTVANYENTRPNCYARWTKMHTIDNEGWVYYSDYSRDDVETSYYKVNPYSGEKIKLPLVTSTNNLISFMYIHDIDKFLIHANKEIRYYNKDFSSYYVEQGNKYGLSTGNMLTVSTSAYSPKYDVYITVGDSYMIQKRNKDGVMIDSIKQEGVPSNAPSMRVFPVDNEKFGVVWSYSCDVSIYKYSDLSLVKTKQLAFSSSGSMYNANFYYCPTTKIYYAIWCFGFSYNHKYANIVSFNENLEEIGSINYSSQNENQRMNFISFSFDEKGNIYTVIEKKGAKYSGSGEANYFYMYAHKLDKNLNNIKSVTLVDGVDDYYPNSSGDYANCSVNYVNAITTYEPNETSSKLMW